MYQREQILFTIMLTMAKEDYMIKYHKKTSPRPSLAPGSTLNDRPPRLHWALWSPHNSPNYERYYSKRHTTITVSTKGARTCLLIRQFLICELRHVEIM
ncbi:hypothetical protein AVEN_174871-1 [Araneus ventricosus]|uniref:Uncharacterized protein n=1 Tax=Araneus ventricosus TaxID=182803 RepID=A0A4Y2B1U1_ARAVE|nr:hypothetical protein AVEN_174871-1 [Araneus ventricosus]